MSGSRVRLADIPALTLYNDEPTLSRRGQPIPQLVCKGKPCNLFQPDVIRCVSLGGEGANVDWKCESDLPESLRLGRVQVSCEGWSGPGDSYVLKGSCSLEYRLQEVPNVLKNPSTSHLKPPVSLSSYIDLCVSTQRYADYMEADILFLCLFVGVIAFILYKFLLPCFQNGRRASPPRWFSRSFYDDFRRPPPPPYSKYPDNNNTGTTGSRGDQDRFGFWSGAALGGLGTYLLSRQRNSGTSGSEPRRYDWENDRFRDFSSRRDPDYQAPRPSGAFSSQQSWSNSRAGPSNLGSMRRSTGFGGSTVR
ncbi:hypothetical protein F5888DRAFT_1793011 [Russula emetica]|nr:hypothetical protein F5888DRAFT_1793011 [Russula emetica]